MWTCIKDASLNEDHRIIDFSDHAEKVAISSGLRPRAEIFPTISKSTDEGGWPDVHAPPPS
jgi:hypothetical protein